MYSKCIALSRWCNGVGWIGVCFIYSDICELKIKTYLIKYRKIISMRHYEKKTVIIGLLPLVRFKERKTSGRREEERNGRERPKANTQTKIGTRIYCMTIASLKPLESVTYLNVYVFPPTFLRHY